MGESLSVPAWTDCRCNFSTAATALARLTAASDSSRVSSETADNMAIGLPFEVRITSRSRASLLQTWPERPRNSLTVMNFMCHQLCVTIGYTIESQSSNRKISLCKTLLVYSRVAQRGSSQAVLSPSFFVFPSLEGVARLPSTARIERAHSDRARSASKEGTWLAPFSCFMSRR